jgi:hypothetical protein
LPDTIQIAAIQHRQAAAGGCSPAGARHLGFALLRD